MKIKTTILLAPGFAIACSKENPLKKQENNQTNNIGVISSSRVPINGRESCKGYTGGLYPEGLNYPTATYATDLMATCKSIVAIDTFGNPSSTQSGKILFVSLGFSTGAQNLRALQANTSGNPLTNPKLLLLSFSNGGRTARLNSIMNPNDPYWDTVSTITKETNTSFRQVQIIYLETEDSTKITSFPGRPLQVKDELETCFRVFKQKFPNVKLVYLLARTTTFDHQRVFNTEPCPYYSGWACKWAIEDQIKGVEGTKYKGTGAVYSMITRGFYRWATSTPRMTDGFKWTRNLMKDGLHANEVGKDTLATRFQNFLLTDKYAKNWYAAH